MCTVARDAFEWAGHEGSRTSGRQSGQKGIPLVSLPPERSKSNLTHDLMIKAQSPEPQSSIAISRKYACLVGELALIEVGPNEIFSVPVGLSYPTRDSSSRGRFPDIITSVLNLLVIT